MLHLVCGGGGDQYIQEKVPFYLAFEKGDRKLTKSDGILKYLNNGNDVPPVKLCQTLESSSDEGFIGGTTRLFCFFWSLYICMYVWNPKRTKPILFLKILLPSGELCSLWKQNYNQLC